MAENLWVVLCTTKFPCSNSLRTSGYFSPRVIMSLLERLVLLMYDRTSDIMEVNEARKQLFAHKGRTLENIPPTQAALKQHIKRACYQANIWNQSLISEPELLNPSDWGWTKHTSGWQPLWTTLP